ncbi:hypothetical protein PsorP6_019054 [Peronosclerospora sorghi]|nr:hypothetical protein PsorP6_019054 [Peronosclerospora sorghi]
MMSLSNDMERLMKEQSELAQLREQLEESKRKLQSEDISESAVQSYVDSTEIGFSVLDSTINSCPHCPPLGFISVVPNGNTNPSFSSPYSSLTASVSSVDLENGLIRLQRSSTTIESTLQDLQSKLDRLLDSQHSIKSTKFTGTSVKFSGSASFSSVLSSSSSSSMLLKNLEKALTQRDQLQEHTMRLEEANAELEQ